MDSGASTAGELFLWAFVRFKVALTEFGARDNCSATAAKE